MKRFAATGLMAVSMLATASSAFAANLLINGDFESGSHSQTVTPTGWTNIGHSDGVIAYSMFNTPAYDGSYFYDLGGFGDSSGPVGDGIQQTVTTVAGTAYTLTFGLSSEDVSGTATLRVNINGMVVDYPLTSTGTFLGKGFTTQMINYLATGTSTTVQFIEFANASGGNNDPMIDGVSFASGGTTTAVPEPMTMSLLGGGLLAAALAARRRRSH